MIALPPFSALALDRAEHLREDPEALARLWAQARIIGIDEDGNLALAGDDAGLAVWTSEHLGPDPADAIFLGLAGDVPWFARPAAALPGAAAWMDLRSAGTRLPAFEAGLFAYARALSLWQRRHRFCTACGGALALERAGHVGRCTACGMEHYPRTDPAVIVLVESGDRILLGRQASWPAKRWSLVAGFVEPGESLEDAARRELVEETGVPVEHCRYVASQPWPFPAALMLGFRAVARVPVPPTVGRELEDARWFSLQDILDGAASGELLLSPRISIARLLIDGWLAEHGAHVD